GNRVFIYFGAANYEADVYLNGKKLGRHTGGFTPFNFEVTDLLDGTGNFLVLKVDNKRKQEGVPTLNTDWWNYGGITRDVKLVEVPPVFIRDYFIQLDPENAKLIKGYVQLEGADIASQDIALNIPELGVRHSVKTNENGRAEINVPVKKITYWSPENPKLYNITLTHGTETLNDRIGFRTIMTKGADILLNGEPVFLKG